MDNIIVNSALWYAEQSSQFLLNSGANKLLDKGYDYYVKEFIPLRLDLMYAAPIGIIIGSEKAELAWKFAG